MATNTNPNPYPLRGFLDDSDPDFDTDMLNSEVACYAGVCSADADCPVCQGSPNFWDRFEDERDAYYGDYDPDDALDRFWSEI